MILSVDTAFDVYSDTPIGRDPDSFSPTLRLFHQFLWSKKLPSGKPFNLTLEVPRKLKFSDKNISFLLSSDSIGHTYRYTRSTGSIISEIPSNKIDVFFKLCSTIGAYMIFPADKIDGKITINSARGFNANIKDRFDLTVECIRLHYLNLSNPLEEVLNRYTTYFDLFSSFRNYIDFFLLQDLVSKDYTEVNYWLPFSGFGNRSPLPITIEEYMSYMNNVSEFIGQRNSRINNYQYLNAK